MKNGKTRHEGTPTQTSTAANIQEIFDSDVTILEHDDQPLVVPNFKNKLPRSKLTGY